MIARNDEFYNNWQRVRDEIASACMSSGRDPDDVRLVAVSKGQEFAKIKQLYQLGQRHFGESYAQEFKAKYLSARAENLDIIWHFIGGLQSNKLRLIKDVSVIQSVASLRHAQMISDMVIKDVDIFIQINLADVVGQQGIRREDAAQLVEAIAILPKLKLRGFMTIAPQKSKQVPSFWFQQMEELRQEIMAKGLLRDIQLSMGMSEDFTSAIECGSNIVRIGTRIFGERSAELRSPPL